MLHKILTFLLLSAPLFAQTNTFIPGGNVNSQTNSYTAVASDVGKIVKMNCSSCTLTLPNPIPFANWTIIIKNINAAYLTVSPNGLNLDDSTNTVLVGQGQWLQVTTDGASYTSLGSSAASMIGAGAVSMGVSPSAFNFGTVQSGKTVTQPIVVSNTNVTLPLAMGSVVVSGSGDFSVSGCGNIVIPGNTSCAALAIFTPSSAGAKAGTVTFNSSAPFDVGINTNACGVSNNTNAVSLCGTGAATTTYPFTINVISNGDGLVSTDDGLINAPVSGGHISGINTTNYLSGAATTLNAVASSGSTFDGFSGTGCGTTSPSAITISGPLTCTASFTAGTPPTPTVYYITTGGSDSNPCSSGSPCLTINSVDSRLVSGALTQGATGTTIDVASGSYAGPITTNASGTPTARITWTSHTYDGAAISTINWSANGSYVTIQNFDGTSPAGPNGFGVQANGDHVWILNNVFHDFNTSGCASAGVLGTKTINPAGGTNPPARSSDVIMSGNVIRHGGNYSGGVVNCVEFHGIYDGGIRTIIENNIISGITGWGIKSDCTTNTVISNNTIFNNGGGIAPTEYNDKGFCAIWDYSTISNNIIVNNGVDTPNGGRFGIDYYHVTGTHNLVTNNLIYGNKPHDLAHHDNASGGTCGTDASGSTPATGIPISGTDGNGSAGGCPANSSKTDSGGTMATFTAFGVDTPSAPSGSYNAQNYILKSTSKGVSNGSTQCSASPGVSPCVPTIDFNLVVRPQGPAYDIGAFEQ